MSYVQGKVIKSLYAKISSAIQDRTLMDTGVWHHVRTDIDENEPAGTNEFPYIVFRSRSCSLMNRSEQSELWRFPSIEFRFYATQDVDADAAAEEFSAWFGELDIKDLGVKVIELQQVETILPRADRWGWYAELRYMMIVDSPR